MFQNFIAFASSTLNAVLNVQGHLSASSTLSVAGLVTLENLTASRAVFTNAQKELVITGASADLLASLSDETGTSLAVFSNSPTFTDDILLASDGVLLTGANGDLTMLGGGDGQDENLIWNFNDTANEVVISTGTGVATTTWTSIGAQFAVLDIQSTTASSTFGNGIRIESGCVFLVLEDACLTTVGGGGGGAWTSGSGLTTMDTQTDQLLVATSTSGASAGLFASTSISSVEAVIPSGSTIALLWDDYNAAIVKSLAVSNVSVTFTGGTPSQSLALTLCQDSGGGNDVTTWDSAILFENGATSTQNTAGFVCNIHHFMPHHATSSTDGLWYEFTGSTKTQ